MKKKLFIILGVLVLSTSLLLSFALKKGDNKTNKGISKVEKILEKPAGIQAYTINGRKTDLSYSDLINSYEINGIACKNGTIATYNSSNNTITLSNIHMPDYCTMDFKEIITIYNKLFANNPTIKIRDDFSTTFTEDTTGTLFQTTESIDGENEEYVYYFAGDAKNNWVKFGKYQTDNVVYRGYYSATNTNYKEYPTMDACTSASSYNKNCTEHVYWKAGDPMYWRIIRTSHDGNIRMLYSGTSPDTTSGYIGTSVFNNSYNDPMYVGYMYGASGTLASNRTNENDSTIKEVIDAWYSNNLSGYTKYLSQDAVYCNDREVGSGTYSATGSEFFYAAYTRLDTNNTPTYNCTNIKDAFSGSNSEAKLTYPIGLMTADEINIAGGLAYDGATAWYYLNSAGGSITGSESWWLLSPATWTTIYPFMWAVSGSRNTGFLYHGEHVDSSLGVRPVISFNGDVQWSSGDGSPENPYEVKELITEDFSWKTSTLGYKILENNPTIKTRTDFSTTFTTTNTGTLYKGSEMNVHNTSDTTVYYFAGDAKNNWVKFAGFYWRIIRTNHDGSIRMLYSGTSPDTEEGYIGESAFNSAEDSPKYAGYMYGTDGSLSESRTNTNDSTIKTYIDNWYSTNLSSYRKYISTEAVYCNNRQLDSGWSWSTSITFYYITNTRLDYATDGAKANPTYDCANIKDAFSGSNSEAKLTYPIGLMTADEINIAGGLANNEAPAYYYLNSAGGSITGTTYWWLLSPYYWDGYTSGVWYVDGSDYPGDLDYDNVGSTGAVRPVISIKADALYSSGDGSPENPYEIVYN